jgi:hypothetical protein
MGHECSQGCIMVTTRHNALKHYAFLKGLRDMKPLPT